MRRPQPIADGAEGGLTPREADRSLAVDLAEVVDESRALVTDLGFRPYRVFVVLERWSSGVIGRGTAAVVRETEIVPTPCVDLEPLARRHGPAGAVERGEALLSELSARYTEAEVMELLRPRVDAGELCYLETRSDGRMGAEPHRRRFVIASVPYLDAERFEWRARLRPQDDARRGDGRPLL